MYNYKHFKIKTYDKPFKTFLKRLPLGSLAPEFQAQELLADNTTKTVALSDYRGKFVVLEFGCMTCAPAITQSTSYITSLSNIMYKFPQVEFVLMYTREAHPGQGVPAILTYAGKVAHAARLRDEESTKLRILIPDVEGTVHEQYGNLPNMVYIIDPEGKIVYKSSWTDAEDVAASLKEMLDPRSKQEDAPGRTISVRVAQVEKYHYIYDTNMDEHKRVYTRAGKDAIKDLIEQVNFPMEMPQ